MSCENNLNAKRESKIFEVERFLLQVKPEETKELKLHVDKPISDEIVKQHLVVEYQGDETKIETYVYENIHALLYGLDILDDSVVVVTGESNLNFSISYKDKLGRDCCEIKNEELVDVYNQWKQTSDEFKGLNLSNSTEYRGNFRSTISYELTIKDIKKRIIFNCRSYKEYEYDKLFKIVTSKFTEEELLDISEMFVVCRSSTKLMFEAKDDEQEIESIIINKKGTIETKNLLKHNVKKKQQPEQALSDVDFVKVTDFIALTTKIQKVYIKKLDLPEIRFRILKNALMAVFQGVWCVFLFLLNVFVLLLRGILGCGKLTVFGKFDIFNTKTGKYRAELLKQATKDSSEFGSNYMSYEAVSANLEILANMIALQKDGETGLADSKYKVNELSEILRNGVKEGIKLRNALNRTDSKQAFEIMKTVSRRSLSIIPVSTSDGRDETVSFLVFNHVKDKFVVTVITLPANITGNNSRMCSCKTFTGNGLTSDEAVKALVSCMAVKTKLDEAQKDLGCTQPRDSSLESILSQYGAFVSESKDVKGSSDPLKAIFILMQSLDDQYITEDKEKSSLSSVSLWSSKGAFYNSYVNSMITYIESANYFIKDSEKLSILKSLKYYVNQNKHHYVKHVGVEFVEDGYNILSKKLDELICKIEIKEVDKTLSNLNNDKSKDCSFTIKIEKLSSKLMLNDCNTVKKEQDTIDSSKLIHLHEHIINVVDRIATCKNSQNVNKQEFIEDLTFVIQRVRDCCNKQQFLDAEFLLRKIFDTLPLPKDDFWKQLSFEELGLIQDLLAKTDQYVLSLKLQQSNKHFSVEQMFSFYSQKKLLSVYLYKLRLEKGKEKLKDFVISKHFSREEAADIRNFIKQSFIESGIRKSISVLIKEKQKKYLNKQDSSEFNFKSDPVKKSLYSITLDLDGIENIYKNYKLCETKGCSEGICLQAELQDVYREVDKRKEQDAIIVEKKLQNFFDGNFIDSTRFLESMINFEFMAGVDSLNVIFLGAVCNKIEMPPELLKIVRFIGFGIAPMLLPKTREMNPLVTVENLISAYDTYQLTGIGSSLNERCEAYKELAEDLVKEYKQIVNNKDFETKTRSMLEHKDYFLRAYLCADNIEQILNGFKKGENSLALRLKLESLVSEKATILNTSSVSFDQLAIKTTLLTGTVLDICDPEEYLAAHRHNKIVDFLGLEKINKKLDISDHKDYSPKTEDVFTKGGVIDLTGEIFDDKVQLMAIQEQKDKALFTKQRCWLGAVQINDVKYQNQHIHQDVISRALSSFLRKHHISDEDVQIKIEDLIGHKGRLYISKLLGVEQNTLSSEKLESFGFLLAIISSLLEGKKSSNLSSIESFKSAIEFMLNWPNEMTVDAVRELVRVRLLGQNIISGQFKENPEAVKNSLFLLNNIVRLSCKDCENYEQSKIALFFIETMMRICSLTDYCSQDEEINKIMKENLEIAKNIFSYQVDDGAQIEIASLFLNIITQIEDIQDPGLASSGLLAYYLIQTTESLNTDVVTKNHSINCFQQDCLKRIEDKMKDDVLFRNAVCTNVSRINSEHDWEVQRNGGFTSKNPDKDVNIINGLGFFIKKDSPVKNVIPNNVRNSKVYKNVFGDLKPYVSTKYHESNIVEYIWEDKINKCEFIILFKEENSEIQIYQKIEQDYFQYVDVKQEESNAAFALRMVFGWTNRNERIEELMEKQGVWIKLKQQENEDEVAEFVLDSSDARIPINGTNITANGTVKIVFNNKITKVNKVFVGDSVEQGNIICCARADKKLFNVISADRIISIKDSKGKIIEHIFPGEGNEFYGKSICRNPKNIKEWVIKGKERFVLDHSDVRDVENIIGDDYKEIVLKFVNKETGDKELWMFPYNFVSVTNKRQSNVKFIKNVMQSLTLRDSTRRALAVVLSDFGNINAIMAFKQLNNLKKLKECTDRLLKITKVLDEPTQVVDQTPKDPKSKKSLLDDYDLYKDKSLVEIIKEIKEAENSDQTVEILLKYFLCCLEFGDNPTIPLKMLRFMFIEKSKYLHEEIKKNPENGDVCIRGLISLSAVLTSLDTLIDLIDKPLDVSKDEMTSLEIREACVQVMLLTTKAYNEDTLFGGGFDINKSFKDSGKLESLEVENSKEGVEKLFSILEEFVLSTNGKEADKMSPIILSQHGASLEGPAASWIYLASLEGVKKNWSKAVFYLNKADKKVTKDDLNGFKSVLNAFFNNYEDLLIPFDNLTEIHNRSASEVAFLMKFGIMLMKLQSRFQLETGKDVFIEVGLNRDLFIKKILVLFDKYQANILSNNHFFVELGLNLTQKDIDYLKAIENRFFVFSAAEVTPKQALKSVLSVLDAKLTEKPTTYNEFNVKDLGSIVPPNEKEIEDLMELIAFFQDNKIVKCRNFRDFKNKMKEAGSSLSSYNVISHFWELWDVIYYDNDIKIDDLSFLWVKNIKIGVGNSERIKTARTLLLMLFYYQRSPYLTTIRTNNQPLMEGLFQGILAFKKRMKSVDIGSDMDILAAKAYKENSWKKRALYLFKALRLGTSRESNTKEGLRSIANSQYSRSLSRDFVELSVSLMDLVVEHFKHNKKDEKPESSYLNELQDLQKGLLNALDPTLTSKERLKNARDVEALNSIMKGETFDSRVTAEILDIFGFKIQHREAFSSYLKPRYNRGQLECWNRFYNNFKDLLKDRNLECILFDKELGDEKSGDRILRTAFCNSLVKIKSKEHLVNHVVDMVWRVVNVRLQVSNSIDALILNEIKSDLERIIGDCVSLYRSEYFDAEKDVYSDKQIQMAEMFSEQQISIKPLDLDLSNYVKVIACPKEAEQLRLKSTFVKEFCEGLEDEKEKVYLQAISSAYKDVVKIEENPSIVKVNTLKDLIKKLKINIEKSNCYEKNIKDELMSFLAKHSLELGFDVDLLSDSSFSDDGILLLLDLYANGRIATVGDFKLAEEVDKKITEFLLFSINKQMYDKAVKLAEEMAFDVLNSRKNKVSIEKLETSRDWILKSKELQEFIIKGSNFTRYSGALGYLEDQVFTRKYLVNEFSMGWVVREKTAEGLERLLGDCRLNKLDIQRFVKVIMGAGKTTCLLPIAVDVLLAAKRRPVLVVTTALLDQTKELFRSKALMFKFDKVFSATSSENLHKYFEYIKTVRELVFSIEERGQFVISSPEYLANLRNSRVVCLEEIRKLTSQIKGFEGEYSSGLDVKLTKLFKLLDELKGLENFFKDDKTVFLNDEDCNLAISQEYNIARGDNVRCNSVMVSVTQKVCEKILTDQKLAYVAEMLVNSDFRMLSEEESDGNISLAKVKNLIARSLFEDKEFWELCQGKIDFHSILSEDEFVEIVTNPNSDIQERIFGLIKDNKSLVMYLAATKLFLTKTFDSVRNCRAHLDRGLKEENGVSVVPYKDGIPKPNMQYGDEYEMVLHTLFHYARTSPKLNSEIFHQFFNMNKNKNIEIQGCSAITTWKVWSRNLIVEQQVNGYSSVYEAFENSPNLALERVVFGSYLLRETNFTTTHEEQIVCNSQDLMLGEDVRVVSGTGDTFEMVSGDRESCIKQPEIDIATAETIANVDLQEVAEVFVSPYEYITTLVNRNDCKGVINCDYEVCRNDTEALVTNLRNDKSFTNRQLIYRDGKLNKMMLNPGVTSTPMPYDKNNMQESSFTIFNTMDSRGVDITMPKGANNYCVVIIGLKNELDMILQAVWRMRALGKGQKLKFAFDKKTEKDIRNTCGIVEDAEITTSDVLKYGLKNKIAIQERNRLKVAMFRVKRAKKIAADSALRTTFDFTSYDRLTKGQRKLLFSCEGLIYNLLGRDIYLQKREINWSKELEKTPLVLIEDYLQNCYKKEFEDVERLIDNIQNEIKIKFNDCIEDLNISDESSMIINALLYDAVECIASFKEESDNEQIIDKAQKLYDNLNESLCSMDLDEKTKEVLKFILKNHIVLSKNLVLALLSLKQEISESHSLDVLEFNKRYLPKEVEGNISGTSGSEALVQNTVQVEMQVEQEQQQENLLQMQQQRQCKTLDDVLLVDDLLKLRSSPLTFQGIKLALKEKESSIVNVATFTPCEMDKITIAMYLKRNEKYNQRLLESLCFSGAAWQKMINYTEAESARLFSVLVVRNEISEEDTFFVINRNDETSISKEYLKGLNLGDEYSWGIYPMGYGGDFASKKEMLPIIYSGRKIDFTDSSEEGKRLFCLMAMGKIVIGDSDLSYSETKNIFQFMYASKKENTYGVTYENQHVYMCKDEDRERSRFERCLQDRRDGLGAFFANSIMNSVEQLYKGSDVKDLINFKIDTKERKNLHKQAFSFWLKLAEQAILEGEDFFDERQEQALIIKMGDSMGVDYVKAFTFEIEKKAYLSKKGKRAAKKRIKDFFDFQVNK